MISVHLSQGTFLAGWATAFCLLGGAVAVRLWFYPALGCPNPAPPSPGGPTSDPTRPTRQGVRLYQVNPDKNKANTDIDIIAIHGLDTGSPDTWIWVDPGDRKKKVNWLADLLPSKVGAARIFTCDWPADLFQRSSVPTTLYESAQFLRDSIVQHLKANARRPILFIASCLGGIILIKALQIDNQHDEGNTDSPSLIRATRGIVFLATPFRGTAFKNMPGFLLKALRFVQDRTVTALIDYALSETRDLNELAKEFITQERKHNYYIFMFWEGRDTVLLRKFHLAWIVSRWTLIAWLGALTLAWLFNLFSPWLLVFFLLWLPIFLSFQPQPLVNEHSATLSNFGSQRLDRSHVMMNKFAHSNCTNECKDDCTESKHFGHVCDKIVEMLQEIRKGTPLAQADEWIRDNHYTAEKLKIERLSVGELSMDQCYINLAIIEQPREIWNRPEPRSEADSATQSSPFSRSARLRVETPDENLQVELSSLFNPRKRGDGEVQPRRILIRGRAGVGKTTLCKKIVYEFTRRTWSQWNELFDRVLWVPLRHLKLDERRQMAGYSFFHLFSHEYFSLPNQRPDLARALSDTLDETKSRRTLFILDGLDEISQDLSDGSDMFRFLKELLDQPNVIIMSRPSGTLPTGLRGIDIELETIGFYPEQISEYLERTVPEKANEIHSFLQGHVLLQDLVRIPIQLDALCFIWDKRLDFGMKLDTMTAIYRAIEHTLWKKDIVQLEKPYGGKPVTKSLIQGSDPHEIEDVAKDEIRFLEGLAFTGLCNDVIDFESRHRNDISTHFKPPTAAFLLDRTLPRLSFLRTSDPLSKHRNRSYHFLHLTYQEYFAARYFVRQWEAESPVKCLSLSGGQAENIKPISFLQKHKYDPRYDIFWRFVTGLLDADGKVLDFFETIEEEPGDLLGPTHQRLVMHCLSEVERKESTFKDLRAKLEQQLEQWLLFECDFTNDSRLALEMECPEQVLVNALNRASEDARSVLLKSLSGRTAVPSSVINVASSWLTDPASKRQCISILRILRHQHNALPDTILQHITARLEDQDGYVRRAAIGALRGRADLTEELLQRIAARLEDQDGYVRRAAIEALRGRADLTEELLQRIAARLEDQDGYVRRAAIGALRGRADLTEELLQRIAARLEHQDRDVRRAAIEALRGRADLTEELLQRIAARLEHQDGYVRRAAIGALRGRADLTEELLQRIAARLEHQDGYVRRAAIVALRGRADLTEELLQRIAARLEDQDRYVREAAIVALRGRADLTEELLQRIAARLEDQDGYVRWAAIEALRGRADLPKELLQRIAARLEDQDRDVRRAAIEALTNRKALSLDVLSPYIKAFYNALLQKSFEEHLYWYTSDSGFIGVGLRQISLTGRHYNGKEAVVKLLVVTGAIVVAKDGDRRPPLHLAAKNLEEAVA